MKNALKVLALLAFFNTHLAYANTSTIVTCPRFGSIVSDLPRETFFKNALFDPNYPVAFTYQYSFFRSSQEWLFALFIKVDLPTNQDTIADKAVTLVQTLFPIPVRVGIGKDDLYICMYDTGSFNNTAFAVTSTKESIRKVIGLKSPAEISTTLKMLGL